MLNKKAKARKQAKKKKTQAIKKYKKNKRVKERLTNDTRHIIKESS